MSLLTKVHSNRTQSLNILHILGNRTESHMNEYPTTYTIEHDGLSLHLVTDWKRLNISYYYTITCIEDAALVVVYKLALWFLRIYGLVCINVLFWETKHVSVWERGGERCVS